MSLVPAGGRRFLALLTIVIAWLVIDLPVSTQGSARPRRRTVIDGREAAANEVLVKYKDQAAPARHARLEASLDVDESVGLDRRGVRRVHSRRHGTATLLALLRSDPDVEYAEPNYVLYAQLTPNDPQFSHLWGLLNTGVNTIGGGGTAGADIDAASAWNTTTGSRAFVVGVVDSGIDYTHPDLAANIWSAPSQFQVTIGGQTITCQAGTHGFNAITRTCDPMDDGSHGTHVAGTIGAVGNDGRGIAGVNWVASMMGLKFLSASGSGLTSDAIAAIEFAIQAKAAFAQSGGADVRILSNSWGGGGYSTALLNAIDAAASNEMLFVAAAGNNASNNDTTPFYPASYPTPNTIAVAATDSRDHLSSFSNYGATSVHLAAPGTAIYSTTPGNTYQTFQGTSMAAPHVSGAAALALAACSLTTADLKTLLLDSVDLVSALSPATATGGRLNVARAIQACQHPRVTSVTLAPDVVAPRAPNTTITWNATATGGEAPRQYRWMVYDGATWSGGPWTSSATFAWTPTSASTAYQVQVRARSAWNTGVAEALSAAQAYPILPRISSVTLTPDRAAPQGTGTRITWTAAVSGGLPPYQYKWTLFDGTSSTVAGVWSSASTLAWTPTVANTNYVLTVHTRSSGNTTNVEAATSQAFAIEPGVSSVTLAPDVAAPQTPNTTVTWTATAIGGEAPLQYRWMVYDGATWSGGPWTSSATFAWTPTSASTAYQVQVRARSAWNTGVAEALSAAQPYPIRARVSTLTLAADRAAPQGTGTPITWTAVAGGGMPPYQYKWTLFDGTSSTVVGAWSGASTVTWTPTVANASYVLTVHARSSGNTVDVERATSQAFAIRPAVTGVTLAPDVAAPQTPSTPITWTATATGGEAPLQYRWMVYDGTSWTGGAWTSSATFVWAPTVANTAYQVQVRARSAWNTGTAEALSAPQPYPIQPRISSVTLTPDRAAPQGTGTPITWTAVASGGLPPYQYKWTLFDGVSSTVVGVWSSASSISWTPTVANANYVLTVHTRSSGNTTSVEAATSQAFAIEPTVSSVTVAPDLAAPRAAGTTVTWTATATGGEPPLQYRWMVHDGTTWSGGPWTSSATFAWTPTSANASYQLQVRVRSAWNPGVAEALSVPQAYPIQ